MTNHTALLSHPGSWGVIVISVGFFQFDLKITAFHQVDLYNLESGLYYGLDSRPPMVAKNVQ